MFNRLRRELDDIVGEGLSADPGTHALQVAVPRPVAGPTEMVELGDARFRVVKKEVPLRDRVVGFKHWEVTAYRAEAMAMIVAFTGELDESWLLDELKREDAVDAFEALGELVESDEEVTEKTLRDLLDRLHRRQGG